MVLCKTKSIVRCANVSLDPNSQIANNRRENLAEAPFLEYRRVLAPRVPIDPCEVSTSSIYSTAKHACIALLHDRVREACPQANLL